MKQLSINEFKALMIAYNSPVTRELSIENYDIWITEESEIYIISFLVSDRPRGHRGQVPGFPSPTFEIEKNTLEIRRVYYGR